MIGSSPAHREGGEGQQDLMPNNSIASNDGVLRPRRIPKDHQEIIDASLSPEPAPRP